MICQSAYGWVRNGILIPIATRVIYCSSRPELQWKLPICLIMCYPWLFCIELPVTILEGSVVGRWNSMRAAKYLWGQNLWTFTILLAVRTKCIVIKSFLCLPNVNNNMLVMYVLFFVLRKDSGRRKVIYTKTTRPLITYFLYDKSKINLVNKNLTIVVQNLNLQCNNKHFLSRKCVIPKNMWRVCWDCNCLFFKTRERQKWHNKKTNF
jgi:hypothetical protein